MRKLILAASAAAMLMPVATSPVDAARHRHHYVTCRRHGGTTGALIGGGTGALVGHAVVGGVGGAVVGGVGGALLGRHIERHNNNVRCR